MIQNQEFENDFYLKQIELMVVRYEITFKKQKINWDKYYKYICEKLKNNPYCVWIFMCGIENLIREKGLNRKKAYVDAERRISHIIKYYFNARDISNFI